MMNSKPPYSKNFLIIEKEESGKKDPFLPLFTDLHKDEPSRYFTGKVMNEWSKEVPIMDKKIEKTHYRGIYKLFLGFIILIIITVILLVTGFYSFSPTITSPLGISVRLPNIPYTKILKYSYYFLGTLFFISLGEFLRYFFYRNSKSGIQ